MSALLLDTCAYSALDRGHPPLENSIRGASFLAMTPIAVGELKAGFRQGTRVSMNETKLQQFLMSRRCEIVPIDHNTANYYAEIRDYLRRAGNPIPMNDIWIAASAMQHGLRLVTTDRHFLQVPQVLVEFHEPLQ